MCRSGLHLRGRAGAEEEVVSFVRDGAGGSISTIRRSIVSRGGKGVVMWGGR